MHFGWEALSKNGSQDFAFEWVGHGLVIFPVPPTIHSKHIRNLHQCTVNVFATYIWICNAARALLSAWKWRAEKRLSADFAMRLLWDGPQLCHFPFSFTQCSVVAWPYSHGSAASKAEKKLSRVTFVSVPIQKWPLQHQLVCQEGFENI